ncbi:MAG: SCO family protein [Blastocatellia bacterium AA13]|nr:MAG: SCO family protein [Blastocatellia bacterium AA13]
MPKLTRRESIALVGMAPLAAGLAAGKDSPVSSGKSSRERIRDRYFPNLELVTHEGKKVRFYDDLIKDKIVIINFMYANCEGICPGITANLVRVQKAFGDRVGRDIFMYSFTLKPEQDTPEVLKEYAEMHGAKPGWLFLTGKPDDMEILRRRLGFFDSDPEVDKDKSQHIGNVRYGNEPLQQWGGCPGQGNPEWIVKLISGVDWPNKNRRG